MNTVFLTKTNYDYTQFWLTVHDMNSVVFKVKACSDVHVGLAQYSGNYKTNIHEVVIGGWENTKSVIRNAPGDSTYMAEADTIGRPTQKSCGPVQTLCCANIRDASTTLRQHWVITLAVHLVYESFISKSGYFVISKSRLFCIGTYLVFK